MKLVIIFYLSIIFFAEGAFSKEPSCPSTQYLVRGHHRRGYIRGDGTPVRATNVVTYCKDRTLGYDFAKDRIKDGRPKTWPNKTEVSKNWTKEERERVIEALDALPSELLSPNVEGIYRFHKSKDHPNPASNLEGKIIGLYDNLFESSRNLERVLAHELAHENYWELTKADKLDYRSEAGWQFLESTPGVLYWGRGGKVVEEDGKISTDEDYANNLDYFMYDPDKLKEVTPKVHAWFKKHFGEKLVIKRGAKK